MADDNAGGAVLVLNAGSSSIKFAVFAADLTERLSGAVTEIGVSWIPRCPASPMAEAADSATMDSVAIVPATLRSTRIMKTISTTNIRGMSVPASFWPLSANALFSMDTPDSAMWTPGCFSMTFAAIWRA